MHLQMEYIKQDTQAATPDYLVNTYTPEANLLDTTDDIIIYITKFFHTRHSYPEYPTTQDHITSDLKTEACAPNSDTETAPVPNASSPTNPLSNSTEEPSNFLSMRSPDNPIEDPN